MNAEASETPPFVNAMFAEELSGMFEQGYVFRSGLDLDKVREDPANGYWHCDIDNDDSLTWSEKVYELFGLPAGSAVTREWAVARYSARSRSALDRVRKFGLNRDHGFILDAEIEPCGAAAQWIRILAVPIVADGRVVGIHGVKRSL